MTFEPYLFTLLLFGTSFWLGYSARGEVNKVDIKIKGKEK